MKYKVGDKVEILYEDSFWNGKKGTLTEWVGAHWIIMLEDRITRGGFYPEELRLIDESPFMKSVREYIRQELGD